MVMMMNKTGFIKELVKQTGMSESDCIVINDCLEENFFVGKINKEKFIEKLVTALDISEEKADGIYNICSEIIVSEIKHKLIHPFKSKD